MAKVQPHGARRLSPTRPSSGKVRQRSPVGMTNRDQRTEMEDDVTYHEYEQQLEGKRAHGRRRPAVRGRSARTNGAASESGGMI